uniref:Uncharacterized protein n=1 Tax=Leersia perrieri TaxID=77586 RepID=A0A0D9XT22_9ORYZ
MVNESQLPSCWVLAKNNNWSSIQQGVHSIACFLLFISSFPKAAKASLVSQTPTAIIITSSSSSILTRDL